MNQSSLCDIIAEGFFVLLLVNFSAFLVIFSGILDYNTVWEYDMKE